MLELTRSGFSIARLVARKMLRLQSKMAAKSMVYGVPAQVGMQFAATPAAREAANAIQTKCVFFCSGYS